MTTLSPLRTRGTAGPDPRGPARPVPAWRARVSRLAAPLGLTPFAAYVLLFLALPTVLAIGTGLFDKHGALTQLLAASSVLSVTHELEAQRSNLEKYEQLTRFGGRLLFPLAHLYRIGRTTIFANLASRGIFEFESDRAFRQLARSAPTLARDIAIVRRLRPFHLSVRAQERGRNFPFDPNSPEALQWAVEAREAIKRLLDDAFRDA